MGFFETFRSMSGEIIYQTIQHVQLTMYAVITAVGIGVPVGILISNSPKVSRLVLYVLGVLQTIPSLAMLGFLIPILGIGIKPSIVVLVIYSLLVIVQNTVSGINQVDASVLESAVGIGMNKLQVLFKVQLPLAVPVIIAGVRVSTVTCVGIATLVAAIGAGGLGVFIFRGISIIDNNLILAGALPAAILAIVLDTALVFVEKKINIKV